MIDMLNKLSLDNKFDNQI